MKKIISLIISASIFLQMVIPTASLVTYAAEGDLDPLKWEEQISLGDNLGENTIKTGQNEALLSWKVGETFGKYTLEYYIEGPTGVGEKVELTFNRPDSNNMATVEVEVFDKVGVQIVKQYQRFNPDLGRWVELNNPIIDIQHGSTYPGGRIRVGQMEIRFKWSSNTMYVQTNGINLGNMTPFKLTHDTLQISNPDGIEVLSGLAGYKISPIHIALDGAQIIDKKTVTMPGDPHPGSKPGVKIEFKRPKTFNKASFEFEGLKDDKAAEINATLEIAPLVGEGAQLLFNLGGGLDIIGLDNIGKKLSYADSTYALYLAQDDMDNPNIVKWEKLQGSTILKEIEMGLGRAGQGLGIFTPTTKNSKDNDIGRYTYLDYTIGRSSLQDAYIEVQPYKGTGNTDFQYTIKAGLGDNWRTIGTHEHRPTSNNDTTPIRIPVPFTSTNQEEKYQIVVTYSQGTMLSQELHYKPKEDLTIPPPTPMIKSIDNIYAVPPRKLGDQPETIGFDLTWSAPTNVEGNKLLDILLEKGNIYYELHLHDKPEAKEGTGTLINVFKVSKDKSIEDKGISVEPYGGTAGKNLEEKRYNLSKNTFTMENVVLKNPGLEDNGWEQIKGKAAKYDKRDSENPVSEYPVIEEEDVDNKLMGKQVPGIYYVTMRALYEADTTGAAIEMGISHTSIPKSITISPLEEVIPVPTKIESRHFPQDDDADVIRQSFSWGNINIDRYIKQMLDPLNLRVAEDGKGRGVYEVYLYQKKNIKESDLTSTSPSAINLDFTKTYNLKDEEKKDIETLRKGDVIRLDYKGLSSVGMNNIIFDGLDTNQVYYTKIRVRLDITDKDGVLVEERHSVFSKEHSFTSYVKPSEPGPGERVPPVPENLQLIDQPNNTTAKIGWEAPDYTMQEGEILYYEMLRLGSRTLAKEEDSRIYSIAKLLGDDGKDEMAGWRTKETVVEKYAKLSKSWAPVVPEQYSMKLQLEDSGLNPNQIYYYYVRTVLIVEGEEVYSSWVGLPVTTDPVQKPIQLKVEDKEAYSHDPKREIVVSFLAPIPQGSNVPSDYDFDIAVQGELDDDYKLNYSKTRVTSTLDSKNIPTGYSHYVYKISGLKPGKRYDIKVRVIDKVVNMVNGQYPKSLYSDRVTTRTHFDQDEQDKDDKFEEYLKYFEDKVEALRRKPYWTLEDGANTFSIKYRSHYLNPEINSTKAYNLDVREGVSDFTYYMPASVIASANLNQTSFEIKQGDVTYSIRPSTITTELEELKVAISDIAEKYIRDYYVVFNFSLRPSSSRKDLLTPEISVNIELARLREEDLFLEDDIMVALNDRINSEKVRFIDDLERALNKGKILDEDLEVLINRSVESIQRSHQRDVKSVVNRNTHRIVPIRNWNKSMLIMAAIEGNAVAEGYLLGWQDTALTTFNVGGGYGIEIASPGTYGFKGQKINMPVIPGVGGAGNLIAKYQLTDFFGIDGNIDPSRTASKRSVLGAMARVLGAPRGADYIQHLKQMNIKGINNIGMDLPMKKGEGIYLLMQVHEKTHSKAINSVYIKNRNAVSNIKSFNQLHQPYVLVAVDSKIISLGSGIGPNDSMQVKDVLQILTNIIATIR
ncbi:MAG TPA: fibronectin type III domain-containing protein [Epulopiscium sp.]|nr:fibronectin type III domain-containing protein [Candidatus Epulonipiscium sp.]